MFNYNKLLNSRTKAKPMVEESPFFKFVNEDLLARLELLANEYKDILVISNNRLLYDRILNHSGFRVSARDDVKNQDELPSVTLTDFTNQDFLLGDSQFDLILFPFGLHWIDNVKDFLGGIKNLLKSDGLFMGNFASSGSLGKLRRLLISLEASTLKPHIAHISPLIGFEQMTDILKISGFNESIIDHEKIELEYSSPVSLMKAIQSCGESSALKDHLCYSITKDMYNKLNSQNDSVFIDQVNLASFIASKDKGAVKLA